MKVKLLVLEEGTFCNRVVSYPRGKSWLANLSENKFENFKENKLYSVMQLSSWSGLKAFLNSFSQKEYGPIPRSVVAHTLAPFETDPTKPWTPCVSVLRAAMGLPKTGPSICRELDSFVNECSNWVSQITSTLSCHIKDKILISYLMYFVTLNKLFALRMSLHSCLQLCLGQTAL